jgi:hypothetical protein
MILIEIEDKIVITHSEDNWSYTFTSIWANQSLDLLVKFLNNVLVEDFLQLMNKPEW